MQPRPGSAREKGPFPLWDRDRFLAGETARDLLTGASDDIKTAIGRHGMRNSHLTAIAPTGTISLFAATVSGGIEPVFALAPYSRSLLAPDGSRQEVEIAD